MLIDVENSGPGERGRSVRGMEVRMEDLDTSKLKGALLEYEGQLQNMRQVTMKNVETLDVIQRYTDKSAAGMQKLTEQSLEGVQRVTAESAAGLRRMIELGSSNLNRTAETGEETLRSVARTGEEGLESMARTGGESLQDIAKAGEENLNRISQAGEENLNRVSQAGEESLRAIAASGEEKLAQTAQAYLDRLQAFSGEEETRAAQREERLQNSLSAAERMEQAVGTHLEEMKELMKQSDEFTHKENVRVYRNVQAVVVEEVKKQMAAMEEQNQELIVRNEQLQKRFGGLRPLVLTAMVASLLNIVLFILQALGVF